MVAFLGEDVAAARPGRDDVERQPEAWAREGVAEHAVRVVEPFAHGALFGVVWRDVITPAAGLVVADDQGRAVPVLALHDGIGDLLLQPRPVVRGVRGMLGQLGRADDVGNHGQRAVRSLFVESVQTNVGHAGFVESGSVLGGLVLLKPGERVVIEVVEVLVHLPCHAGLFVNFGRGGPLERVAVDPRQFTTRNFVVVDCHTSLFGCLGRTRNIDAADQYDVSMCLAALMRRLVTYDPLTQVTRLGLVEAITLS